MVVVGEAFVTKIIGKLLEIGFNYAADQYFAHDTRMKVELERLRDALPRILAVVEMAESGQQEITGALKNWLCQLKGAVDKADDVLDELDYLELQEKVEKKASGSKEHGHSGRGKVRDFLSDSKRKVVKVVKVGKRVFKSDPTLEKLRGAVKRLDDVAAGVGNFISTLQESKQLHQQLQTRSTVPTRETGPALTERKVFGRDEEREELLEWLRKDESSTSVSLFSIIGHGGVGKTTLTQLVYNDESLANSFERKIWVCISTPFDATKVMADMIESATGSRPKVKSLAALQEALEKEVSSRKFLLVLDDAWNDDNRSEWDKLFAPLRSGHKGSKILLTTRNEWVAEMAALALEGSIKKSLKLNPLYGDEFLSLFKQYAFVGVNSYDYSKLESIGEQIAKRLGGLPLAAKMIGGLLNSKLDNNHWTRILQADNISDQAQQRDGVMAVLMLSYHHLPMHLRPCFAYCSIFPQDYMFVKDDMVFMWMSLGFIQKSSQYSNETLEDIGRGYFDDLVKLSFLEQNYYTDDYNMHDLLHDLARKVSQDECFRFVGDMSIDQIQIPDTVRHLYFETDKLDLLKDVGKRKNLRTLVLVFRGYVNEYAKDFEEVFKLLESIRVLRLAVDGMNILPDAIGNRKHLRYLSILQDVCQLPSSFCRLYHLQVLAGKRFGTQSVLGLNNLISLRHLIPCEFYYKKIEGIGTLTSLQRLSFAANVYKMSELKDLGDLRELKICGLENRKHDEEVSMIKLHDKKDLHTLELAWSDDTDVVKEYEMVLDRLQPPDSLRKLTINGYRGARSPCWMERELLKNLEYINLEFGRAWKHLPSLGKLPYLIHLTLSGLPALQQINREGGFQQLQYLSIDGCEQWEKWSGLEAEAVPWCPLLQELFIKNCPKLKALPPLPLSLQKLELRNVGLSDTPTFWVGSNCGGSSCSTSFSSTPSPSLSLLRIKKCGKLTSVAGLFRHHLTSLRHLKIKNCPKLKALPPLPLSLQKFELEDVGFSDSPAFWVGNNCSGSSCGTSFSSTSSPALSALKIRRCGKLTSVAGLFRQHLTSLSKLEINDCEELVDLHVEEGFRHLSDIWRLVIVNCPKLKMASDTVTPIDCFPLSSLDFLKLVDCGESDSLTHTLLMQSSLTSLSTLKLGGANHITLFPSEEACRRFTSLRWVSLLGCSELTSIKRLKALPHLERLSIRKCPKLVQAAAAATSASIKWEEEQEFTSTVEHLEIDDPFLLHIEPLRKLTSVRRLIIRDCSDLEAAHAESWLLQNSPSLQHLHLQNIPKLLPSSLQTLSSLKYLLLVKAYELQSLPKLPLSLRWLKISDCNETLKERCRENEGADWPNIQHIPKKLIY